MGDYQSIWMQAQALMTEGKLEESEALLRPLADAKPHELNVRAALANVLNHQGQYAEAVDVLRYSGAVDCRDLPTQMALAVAYDKLGVDNAALFHYNRMLEIDAHCPAAHWLRGFFLLKRGDVDPAWWRQGWADYEWGRIGGGGVAGAILGNPRPTRSLQPPWDGKPIPGKRLYVCHEQGHGDAMMFSRFLPLIKERSQATVIFETPQSLVRLFSGLAGVDVLVAQQAQLSFAAPFDEYMTLMSAVHVLGLGLEDVTPAALVHAPGPTGSDATQTRWGLGSMPHEAFAASSHRAETRSDPTISRRRHSRVNDCVLSTDGRANRGHLGTVGLCWKGSSGHPGDRQRSMAWETIKPIVEEFGDSCQFVSLLPGDSTLGEPFEGDFEVTRRRVAECDLVISVDTSVAHLAGAMGVPTWNLLAHDNDYRWFLGREDTPWYPLMRLFRQSAAGDWDGVIGRVCMELRS
jgi:hypothetical protein